MKFKLTEPCSECPFLKSKAKFYGRRRLNEFAEQAFPCHKTAAVVEDDEGSSEFAAKETSQFCAGVLIYCEKRDAPNQMMRIAERLGMYDRTKLNMNAKVI
jgi:hypothetical protein